MAITHLPVLRAALSARRDAQTPAGAAPAPTSSLRQRFAVDELSQGRGAGLRSLATAARLGQAPVAQPDPSLPAFAQRGAKLGRGARGPEVLLLQQTLSALGYDPGPLDGKFGQGTERAVKQYQRARGLSADGVVGPRTRGALAGEAPSLTSPNTTSPSTTSPSTTSPSTTSPSTTSPYSSRSDDALLALDPKALPPAEQRAYYDEAYRRAADVYFGCVATKPHNLSKISEPDFERLSAYAAKLGLEVKRDGRGLGSRA